MKRTLALILAFTLMAGLAVPAFADSVKAGEKRVTVGADLTEAQKVLVYQDFGIVQGTVEEIAVTNAEERKYLEGRVASSVIGTKAYSSVYIETKKSGKGLDISVKNITWVTEDIYRNSLITAGVTDARVIITAPFAVSGTAALTGIYKSYENITGKPIPEEVKEAAMEELVISSELAENLGGEQVAALVNELKLRVDDLKAMTDDQVRQEIKNIAINLNITLNADQIEQLLKLCRSLQNIDFSAFQGALESISKNLGSLADSGFWNSVKDFFVGIGEAIADFFTNLFGGG